MSDVTRGNGELTEIERLRVENARLRARLGQQLQAHRELAQGLGSTQQLGAMLRTSLEHALSLTGCDGGGVLLPNDAGDAVELAGHLGLSAAFARALAVIPAKFSGVRAVQSGRAVVRAEDDLEFIPRQLWRAEGLRSMTVVPITHGERVMGALAVFSRRFDSLPPGADGALDLLARQLGAALARSRAKAEQALLAEVVEGSIVGVGVADLDGRATYVNPALARMWGYGSPQALLGTHILDWWSDRSAAEGVLGRIFDSGAVTEELSALRADGSHFPVIGSASLVRAVDGTPCHLVGSFMDVTEVRRGQEALRQVRLADAINGLLRRALAGQDERTLGRACVQVALELSGASLGVLGTLGPDQHLVSVFAVGSDSEGPPGASPFAHLVPGAGPLSGLWLHAVERAEPFFDNEPEVHPDAAAVPEGQLPVSNLIFVPLLHEGRTVALLALANRPGGFEARQLRAATTLGPVIQQVLDYRRSERARQEGEQRLREQEHLLRRSQKLEAIGRLAGGVAHDFNNLLAVVTMFGESLLAGLDAGSELADDAQIIISTAERGSKLTQQLLAFGRRAVLQPVHQQAGGLVLEMEAMICRLLGDDVELVIDADPSAGWIHADRGEIGQVLMNLAVNARDAMPDGGRLHIRVVDGVQLDAQPALDLSAGEYVELTVEDSGVGMGPEELERIFEPFYTTKQQGKGTGLGLATVYGIVTQSGGSVRVDSAPGRGTRFIILLPQVKAVALASDSCEAASVLVRGRETVLLAEDDSQVLRGTARILRQAGYRVLEAANAGEALLIAEHHVGTIHALVTDVDMPRVSGPRLARRLLLARPSLEVLFVSGHGSEALAESGLPAGNRTLLVKPFTAQQLAVTLRALLDRER
jgi:PAS domain S-box-containing protein